MTKVVRGAGRAKYTAQKKKHEQKDPIVGGDRTEAVKRAAKPKSNARKTAEAMSEAVSNRAAKKTAPASTAAWDSEKSLGANVDALKNSGVTWKGIAEIANANGHEVPWPDGGRLLRARKQFLAGTEGQPTKQRARSVRAAKSPAGAERISKQDYDALSVDERVAMALKDRVVPWEDGEIGEYSDEDLLAMLVGRRITYISRNSGKEYSSKIPKESQHNKIKHGKDGPYVDFASMEGPFEAISLSRIVNVS